MNRRSITAFALALGLLALSGRVALAQNPLPEGWIQNWDGSGTFVFLGSPGTGNVGYTPGSFDIPQARYSADHPGWYEELIPQITQDWYRQNQNGAGAEWQDRLSPDEERSLRGGQRLNSRLRQRVHWVPDDLSRRYGPAPRGYRYAVIGGHVVLLDNGYRMRKVYRLELRVQ
jgi:hypothetical protein